MAQTNNFLFFFENIFTSAAVSHEIHHKKFSTDYFDFPLKNYTVDSIL